MRKAMLFSALLVLGACAKKEEAPAAAQAPAAAPAAAAPADSMAKPAADTAAKDTTKH